MKIGSVQNAKDGIQCGTSNAGGASLLTIQSELRKMEKLTREMVEKLRDEENITKKEYDTTVKLIDERVDYVLTAILQTQKRSMVWWGYDNSNDDCASGHFDPFQYRNTIFLTGNIQGAIDYRIPFANSFPTRFLWEDFENEVRESWKAYTEAREKESREMMEGVERRKKKRLDIIESIKSKLTAEELDYVRFARARRRWIFCSKD